MKRTLLVSVLMIFALVCFSCNKKEKPNSGDVDAQSGVVVSGYALRVNASVYVLSDADTGEETDKVKWAASMALGEKVTVGNIRRLTFTDGKIYDFVEVTREDDTKGYSFATQISAGGSLAVVVDENANLFKTAKTLDVMGATISRKTVLAYFPGTEKGGFVEIKAYDPAAQTYRQCFVRLSSLSRKDSDIQSSILMQMAEPLKDSGSEKIRKDALLESARLDYPDSVFHSDILALTNPSDPANIQTETVGKRYEMSVNDDNVNVRDLPDPVGGKIIGQLHKYTDVEVDVKTTNTYTIDGETDHWYHLTEPFEGWVFGVFLK